MAGEDEEDDYEYAQPVNKPSDGATDQPLEYQGMKKRKTVVLKEFLE